MDVLNVLIAAVAAGAPAKTQQLALHMADAALKNNENATVDNARRSLKQLVLAPRLSPSVRDALRTHPDTAVRAFAWLAKDVTADEFAAHVHAETSTAVLAELMSSALLTTELADQMCTPMRKPLALKAVLRSSRVSAPKRIEASLALAARFNDLSEDTRSHLCNGLAWMDYDPTVVVTDTTLPAMMRLAALSNTNTPWPVKDAHIGAVLADLEARLAALGGRSFDREIELGRRYIGFIPDHDHVSATVLAEVRARHKRTSRLIASHTWHRWLDPKEWAAQQCAQQAEAARLASGQPAQETIADSVGNATSTQDLKDLWDTMTREQRTSEFNEFVEHPLCDITLFRRVRRAAPRWTHRSLMSKADGQLWTLTNERMFRTLVRNETMTQLRHTVAYERPAGAPDSATLIGWYLDELLSESETGSMAERYACNTNVWFALLNHDGFPRHRFGEIPTRTIAALLADKCPPWVVDQVLSVLDALPEGNDRAVVAILDRVLTSTAPYGATVTAVAAAVATTELAAA